MSGRYVSYAQALYELAVDEGLEEQLLTQLEMLDGVFSGQPEYLRLLSTPELAKQQRCDILQEALEGQVHPYVISTLKLMVEKGLARDFCHCFKVFRQLYDDGHGILAVSAVTAVPLSDEQMKRLTEKLSAVTGKIIRIQNRVDPACMGGIRLDYDGKRLDGTVQGRLASMGKLLKNTVL